MNVSFEMLATGGLLALEIGLFLFFRHLSKKPIDPLKPRMLNPTTMMFLIAVAFLATAAHMVSLVTGTPLKARRMKGMQ